MGGVGDERRKSFSQIRHLREDLVNVQLLATVSRDYSVGVFQVAFNARSQYVRHQSVGGTDAAAGCFVFISRTNAPKGCADAFIAQALFTRVVERSVIGKDEMRSSTDFHSLR